jgi:hypothetical protein
MREHSQSLPSRHQLLSPRRSDRRAPLVIFSKRWRSAAYALPLASQGGPHRPHLRRIARRAGHPPRVDEGRDHGGVFRHGRIRGHGRLCARADDERARRHERGDAGEKKVAPPAARADSNQLRGGSSASCLAFPIDTIKELCASANFPIDASAAITMIQLARVVPGGRR